MSEPETPTAGGSASGGTPSPPTSDGNTATSGSSESTPSSPTDSEHSGEQSQTSNQPWRQPRDVAEFAAQTNMVATKVLNGEIDLDTARTYASLARVVAQTVSAKVTRDRFLKTEPNLSLEMPDDDEG